GIPAGPAGLSAGAEPVQCRHRICGPEYRRQAVGPCPSGDPGDSGAGVVWSLLMAALLLPCGDLLVSLFSPTPAVIRAGAVYLRCIMPFYALCAAMFCLSNAMGGAGEGVFPLVNTISSLIPLRVPSVSWLANHFGPDYMSYG